ncbi:MAG: type I DNA topoisomerase [Patescibacteria group bacterium]|jgi:DNA topoisomerase-1
MKLIIVESPTKAKTISKFLTKDYQVESSLGHIRDLPKSKLGIDTENNFTPVYDIPLKAKPVVKKLKSLANRSQEIILASDEDREGEAIAWHLSQALNLDPQQTKRIVFHEITKEAVTTALKNPRQLDMNLVDAQQARRILDRLVGYKLSPFLWKKVARGLSAGRVQSVATRLIVEREREITAFKPEEYWSLSGIFKANQSSEFSADLYKIAGKTFNKLTIKKELATKLEKDLVKTTYVIESLEKKESKKHPQAPFTTSTLQQSANRLLGFSAKQTMTVAQKLYEQGLITYMRTDSLNLSTKFINDSLAWLKDNLGEEYLQASGRVYKTKRRGAQEAHEAIRPTEVSQTPDKLNGTLDRNQQRLYQLIWQRAVASQMASAKLATTAILIKTTHEGTDYLFRASGQILIFPGYLKIWPEKTKEQTFPELKTGQDLSLISLKAEAHSTVPPARYSDAGLVKELERHGIGRPSTYAPTINTIITRNYVERDEAKRLKPTAIAFVVTDLLISHFKQIIDYQFTANLENDLDLIASGEKAWQPIISNFYDEFHSNLKTKELEINKKDLMPEEKTTEVCDQCGKPMVIKTSRFGKFLACSGYPECKNIKKGFAENGATEAKEPSPEILELQKKYAGEVCEKCNSDMVVRVGKFGPFLACSAYPKCRNIKNISSDGQEAPAVNCPVCGDGKIVKKFSRRGPFWACDNYPKCKNAYWGEPSGESCPDCGSLLLKEAKSGKIKCSSKDCGYQK